jgi:hypothetical protein
MNQRHACRLRLVPLESRIAPAMATVVVSADGHTATYTDVDGDHVTVKVSTGTLNRIEPGGTFTGVHGPLGDQLQVLDLSPATFDRADVTVSVVRGTGGDGLANVGAITGGANDFGNVRIQGDLGQIDAGSGSAGVPGVKSLAVRSMGRLGLDTQGGGGDLQSDIQGGLGALKVTGDVKDAFIRVAGGTGIGSVTVGGSLIGGTGQNSGSIFSGGNMGPVRIGHDIQGGSGPSSGLVNSGANLAGITVGGSLVGGSSNPSGAIASTGDMGPVRVGHDVYGGVATYSGLIQSLGRLASVTVGGSVVGGPGDQTGEIYGGGDMGPVRIGHNLVGGSISGTTPSLDKSGFIESIGGRIASIFVGGSIISGSDTSSGGGLTANASIRAGDDIGSITVAGNLVGNAGADGDSPVIISARGHHTVAPGATADLAIGRIAVGGRMEFAQILAGYGIDLSVAGIRPVNADAQIGLVTVGDDWIASSLVAGATAGGDGIFGTADDAVISGAGTTDSPTVDSRIAGLTIGGLVFGTPDSFSATDHFGFVAQHVGLVKIGGSAVHRVSNSQDVGETSDVTIREV